MKTMFELSVGIECGGPEDGMMCRDCTTEYESEVNLFQPIEKIFEQVEEEYRNLYKNDSDFIGCAVKRIIPHDEAESIREMWRQEEEFLEALG